MVLDGIDHSSEQGSVEGHDPGDRLCFYASQDSRLGKLRARFWWLMGGLALVPLVFTGGDRYTLWVMAAVFLPILLLFEGIVWARMRHGQALVVLDDAGIVSPILPGKVKRLAWEGIDRIEVVGGDELAFIKIHPVAALAERNQSWLRRTGWTDLDMASLSRADQGRLAEALKARLAGRPVSARSFVEEQQASRDFQAQMVREMPRPWVTYVLVAVNVLFWLAMWQGGGQFDSIPAGELLAWGGNAAARVQRGEWWRLLTAVFLHGGFMHLAMNMIGLVGVGGMVERIYGHRLFLLIFIGSGLMASATSLHFSAQHAVSVGASGAIFGIAGALLVAVLQHRGRLPKVYSKETLIEIGPFVAYSMLQGFVHPGIDNSAHVGGLLGGILLAYILPGRFDMAHFRRYFLSRGIIASLVAALATLALAASAPRAQIDLSRLRDSQGLMKDGFGRFDAQISALRQEQKELKSGILTERDISESDRIIHAPEFQKIADELTRVELDPGDPRRSLLQDTINMSRLLSRTLAMKSATAAGRMRPAEPGQTARDEVDLERAAAMVTQHRGCAAARTLVRRIQPVE